MFKLLNIETIVDDFINDRDAPLVKVILTRDLQ